VTPSGEPRRLEPEQLGDYVDRLYRAAWALTGNPHDAEDLVQDTYARVLARPRFLRHDDDLGYLLQALTHQHSSRGRRAGARPAEVPLEAAANDAGPAFDPRRPEAAFAVAELFSAIAGLAPDAREAIAAVDVAGLTYADAAAALGIKEATLTTRLHRARRRIAELLSTERAAL